MSINFKEELEALAVTKERCRLLFKGDNGVVISINTQIARVVSQDDYRFIQTEEGLQIRFSDIVAVNNSIMHFDC